MLEGMLLVNKPSGMTSHDVVEVVRRVLSVRRTGHTGTLDPMAEGLLIVLVGGATKHQHAFQAHDKTYEAVLRLGVQTDTGDATGASVHTASIPTLDRADVARLLSSFQGGCEQTPPRYSAVKVRGRPSYWWARHHRPVALPPRRVELFEVALVDCTPETITFRVHCSAGTYIRTLGESIAERLGTVGCLASLVRLRIGPWDLREAHPVSWIAQAGPALVAERLRSLTDLPVIR